MCHSVCICVCAIVCVSINMLGLYMSMFMAMAPSPPFPKSCISPKRELSNRRTPFGPKFHFKKLYSVLYSHAIKQYFLKGTR